jgi:hypothetical protein
MRGGAEFQGLHPYIEKDEGHQSAIVLIRSYWQVHYQYQRPAGTATGNQGGIYGGEPLRSHAQGRVTPMPVASSRP